jgi:hypothetical protein
MCVEEVFGWEEDLDSDKEHWLHGGNFRPDPPPKERRFCLENLLSTKVLDPTCEDDPVDGPLWGALKPAEWLESFFDLLILRRLNAAIPIFLWDVMRPEMKVHHRADHDPGVYIILVSHHVHPVRMAWPEPPTGLPIGAHANNDVSGDEFASEIKRQLPGILTRLGLPGPILATHYDVLPILGAGRLRDFSIAMFRIVHDLTGVFTEESANPEDFPMCMRPRDRTKLDPGKFWVTQKLRPHDMANEEAAIEAHVDSILSAAPAPRAAENQEPEWDEAEPENMAICCAGASWDDRDFDICRGTKEEPLECNEFLACSASVLRFSEACFGQCMVSVEQRVDSRLRNCISLPSLLLARSPMSGWLIGVVEHHERYVESYND